MRRLIKILVILVLLLLVAIVAIPFVVPMDTLKNQAIIKIEALTGRKVAMGKIALSVFPNIALSADDVSIGNPAWVQGAGNMAEVKTLRIGVELMPLLHKDIHVTTLDLKSPQVHLIKHGTQENWQFPPEAGAPETKKSAKVEAETPGNRVAAPFRLDSLSITDGSFIYEDSASGTKTFSDVNVKLDSKNLPKSVSLKGSGIYNGTKTDIDVTVGTPLDIEIGAPSSIDLKANYGSNSLNWKGTAAKTAGVYSITGDVNVPEIDTTTLGGAKGANSGAAKAAPAPAPSGERWSSTPISMEGLNLANADIIVAIDKLVLTKMTLSNVKARVKLQNGIVQAAIDELPIFGGSSTFGISASHAGAVAVKAELKNINMEDMMTTLAQSKAFTGTLTSGTVSLTAQGNSEKAMISSLDGTAGFQMKDGTFRGGNLLSMTKNIATSFQGGASKGDTTDFSSLGGTFTAKNGVFSNSDLKMVGPLLQLSGTGTIDLPEWQVHYLLTPQVMTSQGSATATASGISVPVQVEGSLDSPSYHPDLRGALEQNLKDPAKLKDNLKNIKGNLKNINSDTLKGLLGR